MWSPYKTMHEAKGANMGVWPPDLSKVNMMSPGLINYSYNLLTGYHYNPPFGLDVPEGRHFNPYYDHMIIAMPSQLHDGMIEYEDGVPSSAPQMAHDVSEFLMFVARPRIPDTKTVIYLTLGIMFTIFPISYIYSKYHMVNCYSHRFEVYAVKNGGYKKFREKMFRTHKIPGNWLGQYS